MTTNTNMITVVASCPTSVSNVNNLVPIVALTANIANRQIIQRQQINFTLNQPIHIHNIPKTAGPFIRVPNFVPASYVPPPVASVIVVIRDFPLIDNSTGPVINSNWQIPKQNMQAPNGVLSTYQVIQDYPRVAPIVTRTVYQAPPQGEGIYDQPVYNQAITTMQNRWAHILKTLTNAIVRALAESITISDSVVRQTNKIRTLAESITISDSATRQTAKKRSLADTITMSDAVTYQRGKFRALAESISISDAVTRMVGKVRSLAESISITSTLTRQTAKKRSLSDTITMSDSVTAKRGKTRTLSDSISISDTLTRMVSKIRSLAESISVTDSLARRTAKKRTLNESITMADSVVRTLFHTPTNIVRTLSETIHIVDSVVALLTRGVGSPTVPGAPRRFRRGGRTRQLQVKPPSRQRPEIIYQREELQRPAKGISRSLSEHIHIADTVTCVVTRGPLSQALFEQQVAKASKTVSEAAQLQKEKAIQKQQPKHITRALYESITITDFVDHKKTDGPLTIQRRAQQKIEDAKQRIARSASAVTAMVHDRKLSKINKLRGLLKLLKLDEAISDE